MIKPARWLPCLIATAASAADARPSGAVSNVLVTSNHVEDVSSIEAWKRSTIKPGMSDEQKAMAIFASAVRFGHFDPPPLEFAGIDEPTVHDAIKLFNVYGYGSDPTSLAMIELARAAAWRRAHGR